MLLYIFQMAFILSICIMLYKLIISFFIFLRVMHFSKQNRKYINMELTNNISNYFTFTIKDLQQDAKKIDHQPLRCKNCSFPKFSSNTVKCLNCMKQYEETPVQKVEKQIKEEQSVPKDPEQKEEEEQFQQFPLRKQKQPKQSQPFPKNFLFTQKKQYHKNPTKCITLCIDLSGSMCISYPSKYKKVNKQFVSKVLGQKNFEQLSRLGEEILVSNYQMFQMLLNEGQTCRNIIEMFKSEAKNSKTVETNIYRRKQEKQDKQEEEKIEEYITRKEIIGVYISKYIEILKYREPETYFTVVYFNNNIEIPVNGFTNNQVIVDIEGKTVEEMIELGELYGIKISMVKAKDIGDNIIQNYISASQNGQTAMTPAIAFCLGLAKKMNHTLNQIAVITDGYSNIGFGETQNQLEHEATIKLYDNIAIDYAKPYNCVINFITFEDCSIGYDILDGIVGITGGIAACISFAERSGQKIVTNQTIELMSFNIIQGFFTSTQRLCYDTKIMIGCSDENINLKLPKQLTPFIKQREGNKYILSLGLKSPKYQFRVYFELASDKMLQKGEEEEKPENFIQQFENKSVVITAVIQYNRIQKQSQILNSNTIMVKKGTENQSSREEAKILTKQIKEKLQIHEPWEIDVTELDEIRLKMNKNEKVLQEMDPDLVKKFDTRKEELEQFNQKVDKITKEKMSMKSRTYKTYKARDEEDSSEDDGFK